MEYVSEAEGYLLTFVRNLELRRRIPQLNPSHDRFELKIARALSTKDKLNVRFGPDTAAHTNPANSNAPAAILPISHSSTRFLAIRVRIPKTSPLRLSMEIRNVGTIGNVSGGLGRSRAAVLIPIIDTASPP